MGANYIKRFFKKQSQQSRFFQFRFFCGEAGTVKTLGEADPRPPHTKTKDYGKTRTVLSVCFIQYPLCKVIL